MEIINIFSDKNFFRNLSLLNKDNSNILFINQLLITKFFHDILFNYNVYKIDSDFKISVNTIKDINSLKTFSLNNSNNISLKSSLEYSIFDKNFNPCVSLETPITIFDKNIEQKDFYCIDTYLKYIEENFLTINSFSKLEDIFLKLFPHLEDSQMFSLNNSLYFSVKLIDKEFFSPYEKRKIKDDELPSLKIKVFENLNIFKNLDLFKNFYYEPLLRLKISDIEKNKVHKKNKSKI